MNQIKNNLETLRRNGVTKVDYKEFGTIVEMSAYNFIREFGKAKNEWKIVKSETTHDLWYVKYTEDMVTYIYVVTIKSDLVKICDTVGLEYDGK